jgi:hypothetical protein
MDFKEQYASPYKYAGNSPVCMYDPDGNIALLVVAIGFSFVGAFLGGASANDDWRIWKWEWSNWSTYLGIFSGGIAGFFLPSAFLGGAAFIAGFFGLGIGSLMSYVIISGIGLVGAYVNMSFANNTFNPLEWKWKKPGLYSSLLQGFSSAVQLPNAFKNFHTLMGVYGKTFLAASLACGAFISYLTISSINNSFNPSEWKFNLKTCIGCVNSFLNGLFLPSSFLSITKFNSEFIKNSIWGKIILASSMVIVPVIFIWSLKQEMCCDWLTLLKSPSAWEMLVSGIIMGYNLPHLILDAIPNTYKIYKNGFLDSIKMYKKEQELLKKFVNEECEARAERIAKRIHESPEYRDASPADKAKIDAKLNVWQEELRTTGTVTDVDIKDMQLSSKGSSKIMRQGLSQIKTFPKLIGGTGVYAVAHLEDGRTLITHSSSAESYAMYDKNGNRVPIIVDIDGVPTELNPEIHRLANLMPTENIIIEGINQQNQNDPIGNLAQLQERSGHTNNPRNCGEFRLVNILANRLGINASQFVTLSAFRDTNFEPIIRCNNCRLSTRQIPELSVLTDWNNSNLAQIELTQNFDACIQHTHLNKVFLHAITYDLNSLYFMPHRGFYNRGKENTDGEEDSESNNKKNN